jgi:2-methylisocitrate lyase-like PEP mutase family enzyme
MEPVILNKKAQFLKSLHVPSNPLILANVYDISSARTVAALPSCKALATASFAVALANGTEDKKLTLETNLQAVRDIGNVAYDFDKPLSVDLQDGYGDRLEEAIIGLIERGAVGCNLEDCDMQSNVMHSPEVAVERIKLALAAAEAHGVPDFALNARCDVLLHGGAIEEVYRRGKMYLAAGAISVFVLGGSSRGGVKTEEVQSLCRELDGRLNVSCVIAPGKLTVKEIGELGACRISVGPQMLFKAQEALKMEALKLLAE